MPNTESGKIRNVAVIGHRGTGKTSLVEALLYESGTTNRLGSVAEKSTVSDYDEEERRRGMSISATVTHLEWQGRKINLIDTPGEPSFQADVLSTLRVVEGAIVVVSGVLGRRGRHRAAVAPLRRARPLPAAPRQPARPRAGRLLRGARRPARRSSPTAAWPSSCRSAPSTSSTAWSTWCTWSPTCTTATAPSTTSRPTSPTTCRRWPTSITTSSWISSPRPPTS